MPVMLDTEGELRPPPLPAPAQSLLDEIQSGKSLGASRNIRQINDLLCSIAENWSDSSGTNLATTLKQVGDYFIATRGLNTPAIANALRIVLHGIDNVASGDATSVCDFVLQQRESYNKRSLENARRMATYGANLLADCKTLMPFDYSSTMLAILKELAERGLHKELYVLESRILDGGRPIVREATAMGHRVGYAVDMAFAHFVPMSKAILIGAESFQADGTAWNTIGSLPLAIMAQSYQIPFYVATELIKVDTRSFAGIRKAIQSRDYGKLLKYPDGFEHPERISVRAPELDATPPRYISAYITEHGVLPTGDVYGAARRFAIKHGMLTDEEA